MFLAGAAEEVKLAFYLADMFLDVTCLSSFLIEGEYEFAGSQFVIILVSLALQFRKSTPSQLLEAVKESWLVGLPSNLLRHGSFRKTLSLLPVSNRVVICVGSTRVLCSCNKYCTHQ